MLCLFIIPYGLGAGAVDAELNNYVALHYFPVYELVSFFFGLRTIISPYILSVALTELPVGGADPRLLVEFRQ